MGIIRDQELWFGGYRLTRTTNSMALEYGAETVETTVLGDDTRKYAGGLKTVTAQAEGLFTAAQPDAALFSAVGVANQPFTFGTDDTAGAVAFSFKSLLSQYTPLQNAVGDVIGYSLGAEATGDLIRGRLVLNAEALTASGSGSGVEMGATASGQTLYGVLHVLSAGTGTLDAVVESDADNTFASPTTRITFDQASAIGSQWKTAAGPITDTWFRVDYTIAGASPDFDAVVFLGIQ